MANKSAWIGLGIGITAWVLVVVVDEVVIRVLFMIVVDLVVEVVIFCSLKFDRVTVLCVMEIP